MIHDRHARPCTRQRYRGALDPPEPFVVEMLPLMPRGLALDIAAGRGRHSLLMAREGMRVVAVDRSEADLQLLQETARREHLAVWPVAADVTNFPILAGRYDAVVNVNFLERGLFSALKRALHVGGALIVDTFLADQASLGHPRNPRYLLDRYELMELLSGLEVLRYREGLTVYADGGKAWRASALASRREE
jgi:SAM-dependent methyltransferase